MPIHQEVQMVRCTVCRKAKGRAKVKVSTASATTVESLVIRPNSVMQRWKSKRKGKQGRQQRLEMTAKGGQPQRHGQKVMVGTRQVQVGSNKGQQE